jgi:hypothetical protein
VAADLTHGAADQGAGEPAPAAPQQPYAAPRKRYGARFILVYAALGLILAGAVAALIVLVVRPGHHTAAAWSSWKPSGSDPQTMSKEIADHIARQYRISTKGGQLVGIVASKPSVQSVPIWRIAMRSAPGDNSNIAIFDTSKSEMYILCGLGRQCAISKGKASTERGRVLRRESLELALYTFKYVPGVDSIIAFLPPAPGTNPQYTVFLRKADLKKELSQPLSKTLTRAQAPTPVQPDPTETPVIDRLTLPSMFKYSLTQSQEGSAILVLDPLALNG